MESIYHDVHIMDVMIQPFHALSTLKTLTATAQLVVLLSTKQKTTLCL